MEVSYEQVISYDTQIAKLQEEYNKCYVLRTTLYDDLKEGLLSREEFTEFQEIYGRKCEEIERTIENQKQIVRNMFKSGVAVAVQLNEWKNSLDMREVDRMLLASAVEKILIYEDKKIVILLRYQDVIQKMQVVCNFYAAQASDGEYVKENGRKFREKCTGTQLVSVVEL